MAVRMAGFTFMLLATLTAAQTPEEDLKKMAGTWRVAEAELAGEKLPLETLKKITLTIKDGKYITRVGETIDEGKLKIYPDKRPKGMDIIGGEGPNKGKTYPAIYEFAGNSLLICYDLSEKKRPEAFKTEKGSQLFLASYKREKVK
ncbi:MAG: TIGR03067 domain-containing protein [Gemmataceae bacterium]|nr:TIGR03067 domain-containing protein [Gemmataceae bacterium]